MPRQVFNFIKESCLKMSKKIYECVEIDFSNLKSEPANHPDTFEKMNKTLQKAKQRLIEKLEDPENYHIVLEEPINELMVYKLWAIRLPKEKRVK